MPHVLRVLDCGNGKCKLGMKVVHMGGLKGPYELGWEVEKVGSVKKEKERAKNKKKKLQSKDKKRGKKKHKQRWKSPQGIKKMKNNTRKGIGEEEEGVHVILPL